MTPWQYAGLYADQNFVPVCFFFYQMIWSRIKIRGFHPSPRAGCSGVLCGYKWYIAGGGSRKKRMKQTF